jgi:hypothetical protein
MQGTNPVLNDRLSPPLWKPGRAILYLRAFTGRSKNGKVGSPEFEKQITKNGESKE